MKVGLILAGVGMLVVVGAIAFYVVAMPGRLATQYKDDAAPEQQKLRKAMDRAYDTLSIDTFHTDDRAVRKAKNPDQYVRAIDRSTSEGLRELGSARRTIKRAQKALEDADEEALTETPDWPLLGGRGDLKKAEEIAGDEERYLSEARAFLKRYSRLVDFWLDDVRAIRRYGVTFGRGFGAIPSNPSSPGQVTGPLDRTARELAKHLRRYGRVKAPPGLREYRREHIDLVAFITREIRGLSAAVRRLDLGRIQAFDRRLEQGLKRSDAEVSLGHLVRDSNYAKDVRKLRGRERDLQKALKEL